MNRTAALIAAALVFGCDPYEGRGLVSVGGPTVAVGRGDEQDRGEPFFDRDGTGGNGAEGGDTGVPGAAGSLVFGEQADGSLTVYRVNGDGTLTELGTFR